MRKSRLLAVLAATVLLIALVGLHATAQAPVRTAMRPTQGGPVIALLDVSYIFKNHARFKAMMNEMKADVKLAEEQVKAERDDIMKLQERLKDFNTGSPDYKLREQELTEKKAKLSVRIQLQRKEFLQRESKIYHNVYQEVLQEVDYYAAANGITMVLRFSGEPVDVENADDVIRYINKPVIWYNRQLDITGLVLNRLNQRYNPNSTAPHGAGSLGRRPTPGVPYNR